MPEPQCTIEAVYSESLQTSTETKSNKDKFKKQINTDYKSKKDETKYGKINMAEKRNAKDEFKLEKIDSAKIRSSKQKYESKDKLLVIESKPVSIQSIKLKEVYAKENIACKLNYDSVCSNSLDLIEK